MKLNFNSIRQVAQRHGDVHSALVVAVATIQGAPVFITTNRRGGGRVSKWTLHAEERLYKKVRYYLRNNEVSVVVVRFRKDGTIGMAKPCFQCDILLRKSGVAHVFYTDTYGKTEKLF